MQAERTHRPHHLRPTVRLAGAALDGYAELAAQVCRQAYDDAPRARYRADVLECANSGALAFWLGQAGVCEQQWARALDVIRRRARRY
jgi:hypothetical protein